MRPAIAFVVLLIIIFLAGLWWGRLKAPFRAKPLVCYSIAQDPPNIEVLLNTQFGGEGVTILRPEFLCTPVIEKKLPKGLQPKPVKVGDHLQCYKIVPQPYNTPVNVQRILNNQIEKDKKVTVGKAIYLCEPTDKTSAE